MALTFSATGELPVTAQDVAGEHTSANRAVGPQTVHAEFTHAARVGQVALHSGTPTWRPTGT